MELYQLKYFARAARYENISMAAQELHVTQPSISKAIKALERELQVELMRRDGKYCVLTHEGRILQARLNPILGELEEIPRELRSQGQGKTIRLNTLSGGLLLPELIRKFREVRPDVYFNVMERREAINWDLCIRSTLPEVFFNSSVKLMDEKLLLAVPRDSWLSNLETVRLMDLQNENFLVLKPGGSIRMISDRKFKELGFIPRQAFVCDNYYILKRMVEEGMGIAIWPQYSWRSRLGGTEAESVCLRPLDIPDFYRSLYLIHHKDIKMTEEMEQFSRFAVDYFGTVNEDLFVKGTIDSKCE